MWFNLYRTATAIEYAIYPRKQDITWLEKKVLNSVNAQDYRIANEQQDTKLLAAVNDICEKLGLRKIPKVIIYEQNIPNAAFLHNGTVVISTGLIKQLNQKEISAVLAHEFRHKQQLFTNILAGLGRVAAILVAANYTTKKFLAKRYGKVSNLTSNGDTNAGDNVGQQNRLREKPWYIAAIFTISAHIWTVITAFPMAIFTRKQEFDADKGALEITGDAESLISALDKLEVDSQQRKFGNVPDTDPMVDLEVIRQTPDISLQRKNKTIAEKFVSALSSHPEHAKRIEHIRKIQEAADSKQQIGV